MKNKKYIIVILSCVVILVGLLLLLKSGDIAFNKMEEIIKINRGSNTQEQKEIYLYGTYNNIKILSIFLLSCGFLSLIVSQISDGIKK